MQPLFIFGRAITGLSPAPKTLACAAYLLAQIAAEETAQARRKLPARTRSATTRLGDAGENPKRRRTAKTRHSDWFSLNSF